MDPVLISGAGIAGLTTALALAQRGIPSRIFEKAPSLEPIGAGLQLSPNAWHILEKLELSQNLEAHASFPDSICIGDGKSGNSLSKLPLGDVFRNRYGAPYGVVHRGDLQNILLAACGTTSDITIEFAAEVESVKETESAIEVSLTSGSTVTGSALIAADGIWSKIRTNLAELPAPTNSGKLAWRALIDADQVADKRFLQSTHVWLAPWCHVVCYPVRGARQLNLVFITRGSETRSSPPEDAVSSLSGALQELFSGVSEWGAWPLYETPAPFVFSKGRIGLIGDAAHAVLPFAAQGAALAIEDAAVLAQTLHRQSDIKNALSDFGTTRIERVSQMARFARANGQIYHLPFPISFVRNMGMRMLPARLLMSRQDWIYDWRAA